MGEIGDLRILLAEDNKINQRLAELTFSRLGFKFDLASNGKEAFEMYQQNTYDLILMDMEMPVIGGLEATRLIRSFELNTLMDHKVFIVAVTASETSEKRQECIDSGMNDFMEKPLKREMLLDLISRFRS